MSSARSSPRHIRAVDEVRDQGSAALWMLALSLVLSISVGAAVMGGLAISARHRAATAADLAALAAASILARTQVLHGGSVSGAAGHSAGADSGAGGSAQSVCAAARAAALGNDATLGRCDVEGNVVTVVATVRFRGLGGRLNYLRPVLVSARARAGPG